jgi:hypothetical protein
MKVDGDQDMNPPMNYVDPPDCPEGMTLKEYRRLRHPAEPPSRRRALWQRLRRRRRDVPHDA